ncbi:hypothetical protein AG1IA_02338 [Rhizoctonia solani AG-1 IA]|uniref:Uncharacterized protein n=1 Tax=Thanatephorus cucumeris (strain AG1-IA) TaxID=983506 RepID=L8X3F4_THACA|nr:hypothetical protein AG1IA_02338 [Rhizoctonia solani AG-1 IA]
MSNMVPATTLQTALSHPIPHGSTRLLSSPAHNAMFGLYGVKERLPGYPACAGGRARLSSHMHRFASDITSDAYAPISGTEITLPIVPRDRRFPPSVTSWTPAFDERLCAVSGDFPHSKR